MRRVMMKLAVAVAVAATMTAGAGSLIAGSDVPTAAEPAGAGNSLKGSPAAAQSGLRTVTLAVGNMYCAACKIIVSRSLEKVDGVRHVAVSYRDKTAVVRYDSEKCGLSDLMAATGANGFPSSVSGAVQ